VRFAPPWSEVGSWPITWNGELHSVDFGCYVSRLANDKPATYNGITMGFPSRGASRSSIDNHPQRSQIIDAILAGRPVREIASWTRPPMSAMAVQRYRALHVTPALREATTYTKHLDRNPVQRALQAKRPTDTEDLQMVRAAIQHGPVLAIRAKRLELLQDRHDRMMSIVAARSAEMTAVPGGPSGLLDSEHKLDRALLSELREHERAASIECGQWNESAPPDFAIQIVMPHTPAPSGATGPDRGIVDIALPKR
jgi:hypothetical protein